jgi:hypothetical protein
LATNKKPPGTVTVLVHLPEDLHYKVTRIAARGKASELIVECLQETVPKRWNEWLKQEAGKAGYDLAGKTRKKA